MRGLSSILSLFRNEFNKFDNTGARMLDSIYHMTLNHLKIIFLWCETVKILPSLTQRYNHTGQCKRTGGCYNELVVAFYSTGGGVKGKKNLYLLTLLFIYKVAFILFVMTPGAQTTGNIAVYGSAKQLVI